MQPRLKLGRYVLYCELAAGGMAAVYLGRSMGAAGFGRTVAIKRLHPHLARDPRLVSGFVDEARLVARVHHPNVVQTLDVVAQDGEIFLVLEHVKGEALGRLIGAASREKNFIPVPIVLSIITGVLNGLHAAHEATDERGTPLHMVHRDVSPQNILVGVDGTARVCDFGVAKAANRLLGTTRDGQLKGKLPYMAPEQVGGDVSRRTDLYATGVVLWEMLTCRRLFKNDNELQLLQAILTPNVERPSALNPHVPPEVDRIVMKALAGDPSKRYATAHEMAADIDACADVASPMKVGEWLLGVAGEAIASRSELVAEIESSVDWSVPQGLLGGDAMADTTLRDDSIPASSASNPASSAPRPASSAPRSVAELPSLASVPSLAIKLPATGPRPRLRASALGFFLSGGAVATLVAVLSTMVLRTPHGITQGAPASDLARPAEPSAPAEPSMHAEPSVHPEPSASAGPTQPAVPVASSTATPPAPTTAASLRAKPVKPRSPPAPSAADKGLAPSQHWDLAPSQKW